MCICLQVREEVIRPPCQPVLYKVDIVNRSLQLPQGIMLHRKQHQLVFCLSCHTFNLIIILVVFACILPAMAQLYVMNPDVSQ